MGVGERNRGRERQSNWGKRVKDRYEIEKMIY